MHGGGLDTAGRPRCGGSAGSAATAPRRPLSGATWCPATQFSSIPPPASSLKPDPVVHRGGGKGTTGRLERQVVQLQPATVSRARRSTASVSGSTGLAGGDRSRHLGATENGWMSASNAPSEDPLRGGAGSSSGPDGDQGLVPDCRGPPAQARPQPLRGPGLRSRATRGSSVCGGEDGLPRSDPSRPRSTGDRLDGGGRAVLPGPPRP